MKVEIKNINNSEKKILEIKDKSILISKELADYLVATKGLDESNIVVTESATGVKTLKIKSLTYTILDDGEKEKVLNLYKEKFNIKNIQIEKKEENNMKVNIRFITPKKDSEKTNPFKKFILSIIKPKLADKDFKDFAEVSSVVYDALKPFMTDNSKWTIEDNNKSEGIVVKNEYKKEGREFPSHNIFFINKVEEDKTTDAK
jgi:hypothetical protein